MFLDANYFNSDLSSWKVISVQSMRYDILRFFFVEIPNNLLTLRFLLLDECLQAPQALSPI